jgi:hypothetical protein
MEMVTVSPLTPPPEITGSVVVVSVLPFAGLMIVGAAGGDEEPIVTSIRSRRRKPLGVSQRRALKN